MPRLYEQDGKGNDAIVHAHLFGGIGDWWLTEVDEDGDQAFGYVRLAAQPDNAEFGYVSITELQQLVNERFIGGKDLRFLIERDLHWQPRSMGQVLASLEA